MKPTPLDPKITDEPDLTEAEIDALLARLPEQNTYPKLFLRMSPLILGCMVFAWLLAALLGILFHWSPLKLSLGGILILIAQTYCVPIVRMMSTCHERSAVMRRVVRRNAPEVVCYCLDVLNMTDGNVSPEAAALLTYFLPRLSAEERHALTARHRSRLNFLLRNKEPRLVSAALRVIAVIGDKRAISYVESLINPRTMDMIKCRDAAVRVTAQECLVVMQERNALLTDSSILLRASQPVTNRQELLRAATPVSETRPQELLLPADADTQKLVL